MYPMFHRDLSYVVLQARNQLLEKGGSFLARLLILIKKGGLLQLKFGVVGVNIYLWAR